MSERAGAPGTTSVDRGSRPVEEGQPPVIRVGTCSWTDPTTLRSGWYPPEIKTPAQRLAYYASHFPIVEIDSTYYALPSERNAVLWVERTPRDFVFNVKAFGLMTGHGARLDRLPRELRDGLERDTGDRRQVYARDLSAEAEDWVWGAFAQAVEPLRASGKMGSILLQFPPWFGANRGNRAAIERCRERLPSMPLAVEFRHHSWLDDRTRGETLALLKANEMTFVAVDEPQGFASSVPLVPAVTRPDLAMMRLHGRNAETWQKQGISVAERFKYFYSDAELDELTPHARRLAENAQQTHVLFNNCYSDFGLRNAAALASRISSVDSSSHPHQRVT